MSVVAPERPGVRVGSWLVLVGLVAGLLAGCTSSDDVRLAAVFDDVRHLAPQHAVRIADARVGTVELIELDGYRARVEFSIADGRPIPRGTTAVIRQSSLLGENYVELRLPDGDPRELPALEDGATLAETATAVELEDLVREATGVVGAITAGDVDTILQTGVEGIGGRGEQLNGLLARLADLSTEYASYEQDVDAILDGLEELGTDLAAGTGDLVAALDAAAEASAAGARQRDRLVESLEQFSRFSRANSDEVLEPHAEDLARLTEDLVPVTRTLAGERRRLIETLEGLVVFAEQLEAATPEGPVEIFGLAHSEGGEEQTFLELVDELRTTLEGLRPEGGDL